jgi:hypothetical protein
LLRERRFYARRNFSEHPFCLDHRAYVTKVVLHA